MNECFIFFQIVYFPSGHRLYVDAVQRTQEYEVKEKQLPWHRVTLQVGAFFFFC